MANRDCTPQPDSGQSPYVIKPIQTSYKGYLFRSRLEARWAVFLDGCHIEYQYEPEGLNLDGVMYLPDFYLPRLHCWFEVKGGGVTAEASHKAYLLCRATQAPVIIAGDHFNGVGRFLHLYWWLNSEGFCGVQSHTDIIWGECAVCGMIAPVVWDPMTNDVYSMRVITTCKCGEGRLVDDLWDRSTPTIEGVYDAAKRARFEHGETPHP